MTRQINRSNDSANGRAVRQAQTDAAVDARNNQTEHRAKADEPTSTLADLNQIDRQETENEISLEEVDADSEDLSEIAADDAIDEQGNGSERGSDTALMAADRDTSHNQTDATGEAAVGGSVANPEQDRVDDLGTAVGIETDDRAFLRSNDTLEERDDRRWELDSKSAEDYQERRE